jgi:cell division protein FtsQ
MMTLSGMTFSIVVAVGQLRAVPVGELILTGYTGGDVSDQSIGASKNELLALLEQELDQGFWQVDLLQLKASLESHAWVRQAVIRRQWPNQLVIGIDEYVAVARWNDRYLLSATGDVFLPSQTAVFSHLPLLRVKLIDVEQQQSPTRETIQQAVTWFNQFQKPLTDYGLSVVEQTQSLEGDFSLVLSNGLILVLGADQVVDRFDRFLTLLDGRLMSELDDIKVVDLRYVNGLSVRWRDSIELAQVEVTSSLLR